MISSRGHTEPPLNLTDERHGMRDQYVGDIGDFVKYDPKNYVFLDNHRPKSTELRGACLEGKGLLGLHV